MKQILLLSALAGGTALIWVPELRGMLPAFITGETQSSVSTDAQVTESAVEAFGLPGDPGDESGGSVGASGNPGSKTMRPTEMLSMLRNFKASKPADLAVTPIAPKPANSGTDTEVVSLASWQAQIQTLPLSAILVSSKGNRAMFGARSYAVGDEPIPGFSIQSIAKDHVVISDGEKEHRVSLPMMGSKQRTSKSVSAPSPTNEIPTEIQ